MTRAEIRKLDLLWSRKIKELGGHKCLRCGAKDKKLESAHIVGRTCRATRWRPDNGLCLCFSCHQAYDEHRAHAVEWVKSHIGTERWDKLQELSHNGKPQKQFFEAVKAEIANG